MASSVLTGHGFLERYMVQYHEFKQQRYITKIYELLISNIKSSMAKEPSVKSY